MLKFTVSTLDGLDDATKALYEKQGDKFVLKVEGAADKAKLDEFRNNNVELQKKIDELTERFKAFDGVDVTKYNELLKAFENDAEKKLIKEGKIDEVIALRTAKMKSEYEAQLAAKDKVIADATRNMETATKDKNNYIIQSELRKGVDLPDFGFNSGVAEVLLPHVLTSFAVKDGKVVQINADGSPKFGGKGEPATMNEYLQDFAKANPWAVKSSTGGGAGPKGPGSPSGTGAKTMKRSDFNQLDPAGKMAKVKEGVSVVD